MDGGPGSQVTYFSVLVSVLVSDSVFDSPEPSDFFDFLLFFVFSVLVSSSDWSSAWRCARDKPPLSNLQFE